MQTNAKRMSWNTLIETQVEDVFKCFGLKGRSVKTSVGPEGDNYN